MIKSDDQCQLFQSYFLCIMFLEEGRRFDPRILHLRLNIFFFQKLQHQQIIQFNYHSSTAIENAFSNWLKQQDLLWIHDYGYSSCRVRYSVAAFPFMSQCLKKSFWYGVFNSFPLIKKGISGFISNLCHPIAKAILDITKYDATLHILSLIQS